MADKKKKFLPFKDVVTPRRPFILKSEREPPKEPEKEKVVEKEKQPTILLKPREPSTPKDEHRPQSPKPQPSSDCEPAITPSKIAHNENKERKLLEQKVCAPIPPMLEVVKLLDDKLEFNPAAGEFLHDANSNYLVVGILGSQGVGKSMILNLLAQDKPSDDLCSRILSSHELVSSLAYDEEPTSLEDQLEGFNFTEFHEAERVEEAVDTYFKFKMQDIDQIERAQHCTKGVDMFITNDRVVLLDSQALFSPSALEEGSVAGAMPVTVRSSTVATLDCLQIASYLMAVCHVLIVVQDWFTDYNFLRLIGSSEMLLPSLSAWSSSGEASEGGGGGGGGGEHPPHLLLLHNRCTLEDYRPDSVRSVQDLYRKVFENSKLQLNSGMYLYSDTNRNGPNIDSVGAGLSVDSCGPPLNLFLLPELYEDYDNADIYRGHPSFEEMAARLRWLVHGVNRHQISNVANLSEKGWFHYCSKAWETIRKSTFFMEYGRLLP